MEVLVFAANDNTDPVILPHHSYLLAGLIPHAWAKINPPRRTGSCFQHHVEFAVDAEALLSDRRRTALRRAAAKEGKETYGIRTSA